MINCVSELNPLKLIWFAECSAHCTMHRNQCAVAQDNLIRVQHTRTYNKRIMNRLSKAVIWYKCYTGGNVFSFSLISEKKFTYFFLFAFKYGYIHCQKFIILIILYSQFHSSHLCPLLLHSALLLGRFFHIFFHRWTRHLIYLYR